MRIFKKCIILINLVFLTSSYISICRHRSPERFFDWLNLSEVLDTILTWSFLAVLIFNMLHLYYVHSWLFLNDSKESKQYLNESYQTKGMDYNFFLARIISGLAYGSIYGFFALSMVIGSGYNMYLHYDFSHNIDTKTYLAVAKGDFKDQSVTRR